LGSTETHGEGKSAVNIDPLNEARYRYRLAESHMARAERPLALGDRAGAMHFAQLAVENFAKSVAAVYDNVEP
jgi:HEPN domain-containing protein